MKMKKRGIAILAILCMVLPVFAWGKKKSDATKGAKTGGKTTIEFFNGKVEISAILKDLIAEYEKENPNISIELNTSSDSATVLSSRMASDDTPDVFTNWPNSTFFEQVDSGYIMDLSSTGIMDNIQDSARNQWRHNGKEYAATISFNCSGIWYNKDMFVKAGIGHTPTTWNELIDDCKILQKAGYTPFVTSAKQTDITDRQLQVFLASTLPKAQYDSFEADTSRKTVDPRKAYGARLKIMGQKMLQLVSYSQEDTLGTDQDSATANFANGKGAMMIGGSWLLASITSANPSINVSMMPIPGDTAAETNTCAYPGDMSLCIAAHSKVQKEAVAFVKWMTSKTIAEQFAKREGNPSCIKGVTYVAPQFADLYANYVTTGKYILNPDCNWFTSQQRAVGAVIQQLYYEKNTDSFASNMADAFNNN